MTEVLQNPDPLVTRAFRTRSFLTSARAVITALRLDDSVLDGIRDPFILLIDEEALWLCPEDSSRPPHIRVRWSMVGELRDAWDSTMGAGEIIGDVVGLITGLGASVGGATHATLCVPVLAKSGTVELKVPIDSVDGIARDAERRRPRKRSGRMLPWIPEEA